jgi:hypothetical protein
MAFVRRSVVKIAYLSIDEVNLSLAEELGARFGVSVESLSPRDPAPTDRAVAVVYDLDSLPPVDRRLVLTALVKRKRRYPTAVHSYNLVPAQIEALRLNGIAVYRRLGPAVFKAMCRRKRRLLKKPARHGHNKSRSVAGPFPARA